MSCDVVYTWTCDKCGFSLQNNGGTPKYWRYVGLSVWFGQGQNNADYTDKYLACDTCLNGSGSMNARLSSRRGVFSWLFDRRKP